MKNFVSIRSVERVATIYAAVIREGMSGQKSAAVMLWALDAIAAVSRGLVIATIATVVKISGVNGNMLESGGLKSRILHMLPEWFLTHTSLLICAVLLST